MYYRTISSIYIPIWYYLNVPADLREGDKLLFTFQYGTT